MSAIVKKHLPFVKVSPPDKHCFFGYFDKFPWDKSERYLLCQYTDFEGRQPLPGEKLTLGLIDLQDNNTFIPLAESDSWCWQQGCMFQWLNDCDDTVIYNDREGDHFVSRTLNIKTGEKKTLCRPVYCLSPDGRYAASVNFSRLDRERPGYGYPGAFDFSCDEPIPADDGIYIIDLKKNTSRLIVSVKEVTERFFRSDMTPGPGWFNHLLFSPSSSRLAFFHRWRLYDTDGTPKWHKTHMFTVNIDGSELHPLNLEDMSSHYTWVDDRKIINFSNRYLDGWQYHLFTDQSRQVETVAKDIFPGDGHCSYSPDGKWMMTDSYPEEGSWYRKLFLYDLEKKIPYEIGEFADDMSYPIPTRCDLHPNWSRSGRTVCIDALFEGIRQMYCIDVTPITAPNAR